MMVDSTQTRISPRSSVARLVPIIMVTILCLAVAGCLDEKPGSGDSHTGQQSDELAPPDSDGTANTRRLYPVQTDSSPSASPPRIHLIPSGRSSNPSVLQQQGVLASHQWGWSEGFKLPPPIALPAPILVNSNQMLTLKSDDIQVMPIEVKIGFFDNFEDSGVPEGDPLAILQCDTQGPAASDCGRDLHVDISEQGELEISVRPPEPSGEYLVILWAFWLHVSKVAGETVFEPFNAEWFFRISTGPG